MTATDDQPEEETKSTLGRLSRRIRRKKRARDEGDQKVWFGLGMFGLVGWSVALPTLLGLLVGVWIDNSFEVGRSFTLVFLIAGLTLGCFNAWFWVREELRAGSSDSGESEPGEGER